MSIAVTCPGCRSAFDVPESLAGKTIRCTTCQSEMKVPVDDIVEDLPVVEAKPVRPSFEAPPARRKPAARFDDDDDDFDDRPRRRSGDNKSPMILGLSVLGIVLLIGAGVGAYYAFSGSKSTGGGDGGAAAKAAGWKPVPDAEKNGFVLYMPETPTAIPPVNTDAARMPGQFYTGYMLVSRGVGDKDYAYIVTGFKLNQVVPEADRRRALKDVMNNQRQGIDTSTMKDVELSEDIEFTQDDFPGYEMRGTGRTHRGNQKAYIRVRFIHGGDRVYSLLAAGLASSESESNKFFDSLQITHKPGEKKESVPATPPKTGSPRIPPVLTPRPPMPSPKPEPEWHAVAGADGFEAEMPGNVRHFRAGNPSWTSNHTSALDYTFEVKFVRNKTFDFEVDWHSRNVPGWAFLFANGQRIAPEVTDIELDGIPGKELRFTSPDGNKSGLRRVYNAGDRIYTIEAFSSVGGTDAPEVQRFLNSFKLTYRPPAPGTVASTPPPQPMVPAPPNGFPPRRSFPPVQTAVPTLTAKIDPFWAIAVVPSANEVLTIGGRVGGTTAVQRAAGMLRRYSYPDFKLKGSYQLPNLASDMVVDESKGLLYIAALTKAEGLVRGKLDFDRTYGDGVIQVFDVLPLFEGKVQEREDIKPTATISTVGKPVALDMSPDGQWLYCLTESLQTGVNAGFKAKLTRFDAAKRSVDKDMALPEPTREMVRSADGSKLYLTEWPVNIANVPIPGKPANVFVVDPVAWTKQPTIPLPGFTYDVAMASSRMVASIVVSATERNKLFIVDPAAGPAEEIKASGAAQNGYIQFTPDGKTLVASSVYGRGGVDVYDVADPTRADGFTLKASYNPTDEQPLSGFFRLSPDGSRALFNTGAILELSSAKP